MGEVGSAEASTLAGALCCSPSTARRVAVGRVAVGSNSASAWAPVTMNGYVPVPCITSVGAVTAVNRTEAERCAAVPDFDLTMEYCCEGSADLGRVRAEVAMGEVPGRDIVVMAASAGGIEALRMVLSVLPSDLPASVLIVLHMPATGGAFLPDILSRAGPLPVSAATDGERLRLGHAYVAPPDRHLLVADDAVRLSRDPSQNSHRPAADPLFFSAARTCGPRTIAVVLSGTLDDGAAGAAAVERCGGLVVIQDPKDSAYDGMPRAALAATLRAACLSPGAIGAFIDRQSRMPIENVVVPPLPTLGDELETSFGPDTWPTGAAGLTCPECGGPLVHQNDPDRYVCRLGHGWSAVSLLEGQSAAIERALMVATLRLAERVRLAQVLAGSAGPRAAGPYEAMAAEARRVLHVLRRAQLGAGQDNSAADDTPAS